MELEQNIIHMQRMNIDPDLYSLKVTKNKSET
jgi:hypothetical protein